MIEMIIPTVIGIIQFLLSVNLILRRKNQIANISEILLSLILVIILKGVFSKENYVSEKYIILSLVEYLIVKILLVVFMAGARLYCFYEIKKSYNKKIGRKKLRIIHKFNNAKYWPRLKLGNPRRAGKRNPLTKVRFNEKGFPIFKAIYTVKLRKRDYKKSREQHFHISNKILYKDILSNSRLRAKFSKQEIKQFSQGETPKRYTWHHHEDAGVLQLVEYDIHSKTAHIGGYSIWGGK